MNILNTASTDWLASSPVFYNEKTKAISYNINDVIDFSNLDFDTEGLKLYLDFGYSVLGHTPVKNVKFLLPNSEISLVNGELLIKKEEENLPLHQQVFSEGEVIELIRSKIEAWEGSFTEDILIPTSGGFDSRLLNVLVKDKKRILSCSYGVSDNQMKSREIVHAQKVTDILGIKWMPIILGEFHRELGVWNDIYGISTHAHGMYHIEFYKKIIEQNGYNYGLLSGIIGDVWAGRASIGEIKTIDDIVKLGYSHGVCGNSSQLLSKTRSNDYAEEFYEHEKLKLADPLYRIIAAMKFKMILLSYITRVPESLGFKAWSPFLYKDVALAMLNLPEERRKGRKWQIDFFRKNNVYIEDLHLHTSKQNSLDYRANINIPLEPLNVKLLRELMNADYVEWINRKLSSKGVTHCIYQKMAQTHTGNEVLKKLGQKNEFMSAYYEYLVLKPIEQLLIKRDEIGKSVSKR